MRTLVFASTALDRSVYERWNVQFEKAATALVNREAEVENACELIEQNLVMIGATAIEDKLQSGVPDAIQKLEDVRSSVARVRSFGPLLVLLFTVSDSPVLPNNAAGC